MHKKGLMGLFAVCLLGSALPARAVTIDFDPAPPVTVTSGDALSVDVVVSDLGGEIVSAYDLDVVFDAALLSATGVSFSGNLGGVVNALQSFDISTAGLVDLAVVSFLDDADLDLLQGTSVVLATLEFSALDSGQANFDFSFTPGNDVKGAGNRVIIPGAPTGASEPAPWTLLAVGFGAAFGLRRWRFWRH